MEKKINVYEVRMSIFVLIRQVLEAGRLPDLHRDLFDRIIIATAQQYGMAILTKDRTIPTYPKVKVGWE